MSLEQDAEFRESLESCKNAYIEVQIVMNSARKLAEACNYNILHSQAITSVVRGGSFECAPPISDAQDEYEARKIKELFCYIDDKDVKDAVYDSFYDSKKAKYLIYVYNSIEDEPRKARVRVLTRMLWYELIK